MFIFHNMFVTNRFARPGLRFVAPPAEGSDHSTDLGFPEGTPVDDMTPEQQAAYWKNQSKVQQSARKNAEQQVKAFEQFGTVDDLQAARDAAEAARIAALDDQQRAIEQARNEGRQEGATQHANKYLADAVTGLLIAHTRGDGESFEDASARISGAIEFADLTKFIGDDGTLDAAKVQTFAQSIGSVAGDNESQQPGMAWGDIHNSLHSGRVAPVPGAAGSVSAMEQAAYEAMTKKNA